MCTFQVKIWFQNRRTKWKKQENISNAQAAEMMKSKNKEVVNLGKVTKNSLEQVTMSEPMTSLSSFTNASSSLKETGGLTSLLGQLSPSGSSSTDSINLNQKLLQQQKEDIKKLILQSTSHQPSAIMGQSASTVLDSFNINANANGISPSKESTAISLTQKTVCDNDEGKMKYGSLSESLRDFRKESKGIMDENKDSENDEDRLIIDDTDEDELDVLSSENKKMIDEQVKSKELIIKTQMNNNDNESSLNKSIDHLEN